MPDGAVQRPYAAVPGMMDFTAVGASQLRWFLDLRSPPPRPRHRMRCISTHPHTSARRGQRGVRPTRLRDGQRCQKVTILSAAVGSYWSERGYRWAAALRRCYAALHGYSSRVDHTEYYKHGDGTTDDRWTPAWNKVFAVAKALSRMGDGEWLLWMDADVVITNASVRLVRDFIDRWSTPTTELIVADSRDGCNNGVFFLRSSLWSRLFLLRWWLKRDEVQAAADNGAFMHVLLDELLAANRSKAPHESDTMASGSAGRQCAQAWRESGAPAWVECYTRLTTGVAQPPGRRTHPRIRFLWGAGMNAGVGWDAANQFKHGDFALHFAGVPGRAAAMEAWIASGGPLPLPWCNLT